MLIRNNKFTYSPTDLVRFFESEFASYMDHLEQIISDTKKSKLKMHHDPADPLLSLIKNMGNQHEKDIISRFEKSNTVIHIDTNINNRELIIKQTLKVLQTGEPYIYQAAIKKDIIFGFVDLLVKQKGASNLGDYHYIPYDFKISKHPKPSAIIQLCCYCDILNTLQGFMPNTFCIITKDNIYHHFKTNKFFDFYQFLTKQFLQYHSNFDKKNIPIPHKKEQHGHWSLFAKKQLYQSNDISLIAGINSTYIYILKKAGIVKLIDITKQKNLNLKGIPQIHLKNLQDQALLQLASADTQKPEFKLLTIKENQYGLKMLPPSHAEDIFFHIESYPLLQTTSLEYLYGYAVNKNKNYVCFIATNKKQEAFALSKWLNNVYQIWKNNPDMHIYHYKHFEVTTLKKLVGKYNIGENKLDELLKHKVFIDLHQITTQALRIGTSSYDLIDIEALYSPKKNTEIISKTQAILQFSYFLNSKDNFDDSPFLKKIKIYNQDTCCSIKQLCKFLIHLQKKHNIKYRKAEIPKSPAEDSYFIKQCEQKAIELLKTVPADLKILPLSKMTNNLNIYTQALLAHLLEFYIQEDLPNWWDYLSYLNMEAAELIQNKHTIAHCRLEKSKNNMSKIIFEKEQEINFKVKSTVIILENKDDIKNKYIISHLYLNLGCLYLTPTHQNKVPAHKTFTLISEQNIFYKKNIFCSLLKTANDFLPTANSMGLKKCIYDLLLKQSTFLPHFIKTNNLNKKNTLKQTTQQILNLQNSVFCIQGSPGSGKTYTIANIILQLVKAHKRVGVMANSHQAISQVLKKIIEQNTDNFNFICQKVTNLNNIEEDKKIFNNLSVELVNSYQVNPLAQVVGGTTYLFSNPFQEGGYDYLFIDEASQVNLASIVSAARATKNIILIGDQKQLQQPIKASHPGELKLSGLSYFTNNDITIQNNKGTFLHTSYRMHPKICKFISDVFYDQKLTSHPSTKAQKIILTPSLKKQYPLIPESGLCFIPVDHLGNTHFCVEEAKIIASIYKQLLKTSWINKTKKSQPITPHDILIVSPYNFQVDCLKKELQIPEARISSVDKFQGQEAAISILSLATSTIKNDSQRINFLLNKNRLNVALSRAYCVSIIVGSVNLTDIHVSSVDSLELMNLWCQITNNNL